MSTQKQTSKNTAIKEVLSYTPPQLYTGKEWYVGFYAFCPVQGKMRRKKIKLNFVEKIGERRRYAQQLMLRVSQKLQSGWNPWIESENGNAYHTLADVFDRYRTYIDKQLNDETYRLETHTSYLSYIRNIEAYNSTRTVPITYIYQFDRSFVVALLEYVYIDRDNTPTTRNNYLAFLKTLSSWLIEKQYINKKPTEGISKISKKQIKKKRTIISKEDICRLHDYLSAKNKHYLLACYLLHYCFIRPKELSMLRLRDFSLKEQTIHISEDISKNRQTAYVTLPTKVAALMIDLDVFSSPSSDYLFGEDFRPSAEFRDSKQFRDYWTRYIRKDLKFPESYKLYSLKDTGITDMLRKYDSITVRDQARHADILMTDTYTPHDIQKANTLIINHNGDF